MTPLKRLDVIDLMGPLRRYARSLTRDDTQADDLVHDALLRALERQHTLRPGSNLRTWLMAVLHNVFIDGQRRRRTENRHAETLVHEGERTTAPGQEHSVRLAQIRRAFSMLPDEQRAALHLVTIDGLSYQEAAAVLEIPIGTLMSRIGRARAALRLMEDGSAPALPSLALPSPGRPHLRLVEPDGDETPARGGARG